jgi:ribosomal-protein-serine acetyltransferase
MQLSISDTTHLRPLGERDARELHALIEANRPVLRPWLAWASTQTLDQTRHFLREAEAQRVRDEGFQAAVVCAGEIAGVIGYVNLNRHYRSTNIGYWLAVEHQGRGTMTAAVRTLVGHAFSALGLNRVEIRAASENNASRAIPERLGFREEGTMRQAEFVDERFLDSVVYSMLAEDWPSAG